MSFLGARTLSCMCVPFLGPSCIVKKVWKHLQSFLNKGRITFVIVDTDLNLPDTILMAYTSERSRNSKKNYDPLYFLFLKGVTLLQLFWMPSPFRDIGCCRLSSWDIFKLTPFIWYVGDDNHHYFYNRNLL